MSLLNSFLSGFGGTAANTPTADKSTDSAIFEKAAGLAGDLARNYVNSSVDNAINGTAFSVAPANRPSGAPAPLSVNASTVGPAAVTAAPMTAGGMLNNPYVRFGIWATAAIIGFTIINRAFKKA